ncbi:MAG TPA: 16S rRNA (adenine(1518)-N(6)/adenine(1519)-N(6))-dimethyltransferase RsmA [Candidatus Paceibacterota bacterium]|nr:16S rRNA (adenine(1518)-N(6)/adenine(1519)-N(6))-dimethyltransferase RsmA [Candidatus Paceibacterota bacterium]
MTKIQDTLKQYNIHPKKYMGQNFLIDENVLNKIIGAANLSPEDTVLEIGPGLGILTIELAKRAKKVITIEKDKNLCEVLQKTLDEENIKNVKIINGDILKIKPVGFPNYKIVANIPYYLTSPIIRKFLEAGNKPAMMILMVQKEVAQRITAKPPHMNILSIAVQFYAEPEIIDYVPKSSFSPMPKVDSAIMKIIPKQIPEINTEKFFTLVKKGFSAKRKMLKNNLSILLKANQINLEKIGLNPKVRAENLSIDDWIKIYHDFYS